MQEYYLSNQRLSGIRTESSECIYGMLKRRWPILKCMRVHLPFAMDLILCCCILHNIAVKWNIEEVGDEDPDDDMEEGEEGEEEEEQDGVVQIMDDAVDNATTRARGALLRDNLRAQMPPPTGAERRAMNV